MDRRTSDIWKHFSKIDSSIAKCDTCKKSYSYKTSVTNLKKHLNNAHLIYLYTENDTLQVTYVLIHLFISFILFLVSITHNIILNVINNNLHTT